jgi:RHS repeat-associated protein
VVRWVFSNGVGSGVVYANDTPTVVRRRVFEPFGRVIAETGTESPDVSFTGKLLNDDAQLYAFGARWYDAETGQFTAVDPIVADAADPKTHNGYAYVGGDPANFVDPTGMCASKPDANTPCYTEDAGVNENLDARIDVPDEHEGVTPESRRGPIYSCNVSGGGCSRLAYQLRQMAERQALAATGTLASAAAVRERRPDLGSDAFTNWLTERFLASNEIALRQQLDSQTMAFLLSIPGPRAVFAVEDGRVFRAGWQNSLNHESGLGWRVSIIASDGQSYTQYGHMDPTTTPAVGTHVREGDYIGDYADPTNGRSDGPHVHLERRAIVNPRTTVDPGTVSPVRNGRVTTQFGERDALHPQGHQGVDWVGGQ